VPALRLRSFERSNHSIRSKEPNPLRHQAILYLPTEMAKSEKLGAATLRVKMQRPVVRRNISKKQDIFVGKQTPKHTFPWKLKSLLQKYLDKNNLDILTATHATKRKKRKRKTIVNGFTAFRSYYSKFGKSYEEQEQLSKELATFWKNEPSIQPEWHAYSEEYKVAETDLSFVEWFDNNKSILGRSTARNNTFIQSATISHLVVEDVYDTCVD
jgi:hypothetical protein